MSPNPRILRFQAFAQGYTLDTPRERVEAELWAALFQHFGARDFERVHNYYSIEEVPCQRMHHGILAVCAKSHALQFFDEGAE